MKLILLKTNIVEGLFSVERATGINTNLPVLKNILLSAQNNKISITATNLELAITHTIQGKIIENGRAVMPAVLFGSVIKNLNSERITIETNENTVRVITDNYEATIQGGNEKDFPIIPHVSDVKNSIRVAVDVFLESLGSTIIATQYSDIRPEISGVFFTYSNEKLTFVGTDSFRLAEKIISGSGVASTFDEVSFIIPLQTAEELMRVIQKSDDEVTIHTDQNQVFFITKTKFVTSRTVDGRFPEYQPIIPKSTENEISINRQELLNAIKLVSSFSGRTNDITISVGENKKFIEISSQEGSLGSSVYKVPSKVKGEIFSVVFNWKYLYDGLRIYSSDEIILGVNTPDKPAVIRDPKEPSLLYVVMPIRK
ncbi:MAG: DNA polymerase III subunit beta [Candidatus Jorgensenbacteria bacterium]|nr:DNA polymerase III subunit beta [Candidatus Jorgensenbacteria bacterium]